MRKAARCKGNVFSGSQKHLTLFMVTFFLYSKDVGFFSFQNQSNEQKCCFHQSSMHKITPVIMRSLLHKYTIVLIR